MKDNKKMALLVLTLAVSISAALPTLAQPSEKFNVAIVDIPKIVSSSTEIKDLNKDRMSEMKILSDYAADARAQVEKASDIKTKEQLTNKYNTELNIKKVNFDKEFSQKLITIDKKITTQVDSKAKTMGYDLVLSKQGVISGATDITDEVLKVIK